VPNLRILRKLRMTTAGQPSLSAALRAKTGANEPIRTVDLLITSELLYQLSYVGLKGLGTGTLYREKGESQPSLGATTGDGPDP
jgi:hypothetical protein